MIAHARAQSQDIHLLVRMFACQTRGAYHGPDSLTRKNQKTNTMKKIGFISVVVLLVVCLSSCCARRAEVSGGSNGSGGAPGSIKGKCAVLDFQTGTNVTAEEVEAITYNFRTGFYPSCYKMIEAPRVNSAVDALGYSKTGMTKEQLCEVGRKLEANLVVVGTVNKLMDEYSVDVQIVNVATGVTIASEGDAFQKSEYRREIKNIAQHLVYKID